MTRWQVDETGTRIIEWELLQTRIRRKDGRELTLGSMSPELFASRTEATRAAFERISAEIDSMELRKKRLEATREQYVEELLKETPNED